MKKIIILSDTGKPRYGLVLQLEKLFPECEIQILPRHAEDIEEDMIEPAVFSIGNFSAETAS
jgi:hypothetical protein